jgi:glycosyltransferase involved in cell wall biosynthesis
MILGGAQENTLHTCHGLSRSDRWDVRLVTGPAIGPEGELLTEARRLGLQPVMVPALRRNLHPVWDPLAFWQLLRTFRRLSPTIVHTHSSKAGVLGRVAARMAGVPIVVHTVEGLPFHRYSPRLQYALYVRAERFAARYCDHITCVAEAMAQQLLDARVGSRDMMSIIYSGMEVADYVQAGPHRDEVRRLHGIGPDEIVIGKIARLFPLKGHRFVIDAAPRILEACPNARFLFVGNGILRQELEDRAARAGVRDRFSFTGLVPPDDIPGLVSAMDVVVHASLREGLARVLVQGLLCEKPVVTYSLDGAPEVIIPGETGYLVEPESVDGLADAVLRAIRNPDEAGAMAREGRRRFADRFRICTMVRETEALYGRLLAEQTA